MLLILFHTQSSFTSNASADTSQKESTALTNSTPSVGDGSTSTDPIMAALTQTLSVHGIDIIREVNYDSITPLPNLAQ